MFINNGTWILFFRFGNAKNSHLILLKAPKESNLNIHLTKFTKVSIHLFYQNCYLKPMHAQQDFHKLLGRIIIKSSCMGFLFYSYNIGIICHLLNDILDKVKEKQGTNTSKKLVNYVKQNFKKIMK